MQQVATYETVSNTCEQLKQSGQKVTGRAVRDITGGSLGTVLSHIKQWRQGTPGTLSTVSTEIPADLQTAILRALDLCQIQAKEKLQNDIEQAALREAEALEGLAEAEKNIEELSDKLADTMQQLTETRQAAETTAAIANEKNTSLNVRVETLETERRELTESAEKARTESMKAMLQVERADQATAKAEKRLQELEGQFTAIQQQKIEAEKIAALAEQKKHMQAETLVEARATIAELKKEKAEAITEKKQEIKEARQTITGLEKQIALFLTEKAAPAPNKNT